jgi:hypothetical protein
MYLKCCLFTTHRITVNILFQITTLTQKASVLFQFLRQALPPVIYYSRDLMIPQISAQHCPPRNISLLQSHACQADCKLYFLFANMFHCHKVPDSDRCKPGTALFDVWISNEELATALQFSARGVACYVTRRWD